MQLSDHFLSNPDKIVITQLSELDKSGLYKSGNQGLVDCFINDAMTSDMQKALENIPTSDIVQEYYFDTYGHALTHRKFKVIRASKIIDVESFKDLEIDDITMAPYDFSVLSDTYKAQYALVFQPYLFGAERPYYGFIPLGGPKGYIKLAVYLVNLENNMLEGYYATTVEAPVHGEWDEPTDFPNLLDASRYALKTALKRAYNFFFVDNDTNSCFEKYYAKDAS